MDTPTLLEGQLQSSCLDQNDHGAPAVTYLGYFFLAPIPRKVWRRRLGIKIYGGYPLMFIGNRCFSIGVNNMLGIHH